MTVVEKLNKLRALMKERKMDVYMIPTSDFHETEYVGEHFKARSFMSGFTGSAGTLIVCKDCAALWTDGRYFIQAADQLKDSTIDLMKQGEEGVPSIPEYINEHIQMNGVFGFDGRVMNTKQVKDIMDQLKDKHITICAQEDLVGMIWEERPALPTEKGFFLEEKYSGKSTKDKLADIRDVMKEHKATHHIVTSLDDIAWIMNMRGWDISCFPVMLCYLVITEKESHIFINKDKLDERMHANFKDNMVIVHASDDIYEFVKTIPADAAVLLHTSVVNYAITQNLNKEIRIIDCPNPSQLMKARKNEIELENNIGKETITEISASDYLEGLRRAQENNLGLSFNTISAYKEHAAMMHYSANEETNVELKPEGMLLVDSGGQYLEGTTDITRTFVLGPISDEIRIHYTSALRGMIQLSKARFLEGCRGMNLDILARGPLWEMGIDYKCGTGHGVGHLMNVHEGPNGFRWKIVPERNDSCVLEEGMTQSNEPGVYVEGSHGIRHENEMVVRKGEKNEYGQFMYFETITFVPFDLDGLDVSLMTRYDIEWLNAYHAEVFAKVSPYLNEAEKEWLKHATRAI